VRLPRGFVPARQDLPGVFGLLSRRRPAVAGRSRRLPWRTPFWASEAPPFHIPFHTQQSSQGPVLLGPKFAVPQSGSGCAASPSAVCDPPERGSTILSSPLHHHHQPNKTRHNPTHHNLNKSKPVLK
jgi:hypothetical protein